MPLINSLSTLAIVLLAITHSAHAGLGITFVNPAAGSTWPAGPFTVSWQDAGSTPSMSDMVDYTLSLIIGGNSNTNSQVLQTIGAANGPVSAGSIEDDISADISASSQNGFYLKMVANTTTGSSIVNYSSRFTLIGLNGTTDEVYLSAARAANGANDVPAAYSIVLPTTTTAPSSSATSTPSRRPSRPASGDDNDGDSKAINVGLIIGGIFAIIGAVSIVAWILFFIRRRKRSKAAKLVAKEASAKRRTQILLDFKAELPANHEMRRSRVTTGELSPESERYEADGGDSAFEMQAQRNTIYHELEGSAVELEAGSGRRSRIVSNGSEGRGGGRWSWRSSVNSLTGNIRRSRDVQPPPPPV
jgi:hypothetical protein